MLNAKCQIFGIWHLSFRICRSLADGKRVLEIGVRTRNHVNRHELADAPRGGGAGIGCGLHGRDGAAGDGGHVPGANLIPADKRHFGGLHPGIRRFDHRDEPLGFDHPERFTHSNLPYLISRTAASISAVSSRYVSRISPSASGTRRAPPPSGANTVWQLAWSPSAELPGPGGQIGAGAAMPYMPRSPWRRSTSCRDSRRSPPSSRATRLIFAKCSIVSIL